MESNKEEAARAVRLAEKFLYEKGDKDKAIRFLKKSLSMDPSNTNAKQLLAKAEAMSAANGTEGVRQRSSNTSNASRATNARASRAPDPPPQKAYTPEQKRGVDRIKRCKNLYGVLDVEATASQAEIKKAYRKLALKFHPDKNGAPGADEAFKEINRAFSILSDEGKRREYDQFGTTDDTRRAGFTRQYYGDDFDPNDIFREVFGTGFNGGPGVRMYTFGPGFGFQTHRRNQQQRAPQAANQAPGLIQLLPLLFLFALSFMSYDTRTDSSRLFSLSQTSKFPIKQATRARGIVPDIPYYVGRNFNSLYRRDQKLMVQVEQAVQREYYHRVQERCQQEKVGRKRKLQKAKKAKDKATFKSIMEKPLAYCDEISRLNGLGLAY